MRSPISISFLVGQLKVIRFIVPARSVSSISGPVEITQDFRTCKHCTCLSLHSVTETWDPLAGGQNDRSFTVPYDHTMAPTLS